MREDEEKCDDSEREDDDDEEEEEEDDENDIDSLTPQRGRSPPRFLKASEPLINPANWQNDSF